MKTLKVAIVLIIISIGLAFVFNNSKAEERNKLPDWAMGGFIQPENVNPVLTQDFSFVFYCPAIEKKVNWESGSIFNPSAIVRNDSIVLFYRAEDNSGEKTGKRTSRIGCAVSTDGFSFEKENTPVLYPDKDEQAEHEWLGGCEDPRISVTADGTYIMFYTQWNRHYPRLAVAHSHDLRNWTKYGPVFKNAYNGKYYNTPSKSASIITKITDGNQFIEKIDEQYFMYWGDNSIFGAVSYNLIDWFPLEDENGELKKLLTPRNNYFDSNLLECGPAALLTDKGILLLYSGENKAGEFGNRNYSDYMIAGGQALFDKDEPEKLLGRLDEPFFLLENDSIASENKIFIQSLAYFNNEWFLYYGNGGSKIEVAILKSL